MALKNLFHKEAREKAAAAACGTACGAGEKKPQEQPAACGTACGTGDKYALIPPVPEGCPLSGTTSIPGK